MTVVARGDGLAGAWQADRACLLDARLAVQQGDAAAAAGGDQHRDQGVSWIASSCPVPPSVLAVSLVALAGRIPGRVTGSSASAAGEMPWAPPPPYGAAPRFWVPDAKSLTAPGPGTRLTMA